MGSPHQPLTSRLPAAASCSVEVDRRFVLGCGVCWGDIAPHVSDVPVEINTSWRCHARNLSAGRSMSLAGKRASRES